MPLNYKYTWGQPHLFIKYSLSFLLLILLYLLQVYLTLFLDLNATDYPLKSQMK